MAKDADNTAPQEPQFIDVAKGDFIVCRNMRFFRASENEAGRLRGEGLADVDSVPNDKSDDSIKLSRSVTMLCRALEPFSYEANAGAEYESVKQVELKKFFADPNQRQWLRSVRDSDRYIVNYENQTIRRHILNGNGVFHENNRQGVPRLIHA